MKTRVSGIVLLLLLFACKTTDTKDGLYAYLTNTSRFYLLPPEYMEKPVDMAQSISALYNDDEFYFNAWVKTGGGFIEMVLMSEMGTEIGRLSYDGKTISFSSSVLPSSLKPEYVIADFELCFFSPDAILPALKQAGLDFISEKSGSTEIRRVFEKGKLIIQIEKTASSVTFSNELRGYSYTIMGNFP
jgi:hypothetical protein